jgi:hypothetical protein
MLTRIDLSLQSVWWRHPPEIKITIADHVLFAGALEQDQVFNFEQDLPPGEYMLDIKFYGKTDLDTDVINNRDTAVIVNNIIFNNISSEKFVWQGQYRPEYPVAWLQQQIEMGKQPDAELHYHTYLGWNGTWSLRFSTPIFTWIHRVENLGWVYE